MIDKIFNEDCLEGMKRIPSGSVDMVMCDPGNSHERNNTEHRRKRNQSADQRKGAGNRCRNRRANKQRGARFHF